LATWVDQRKGRYLIGDHLTLADIAIIAFLGWFAIRWSEHDWQTQYPALKAYWAELEELEHFKTTRPSPQTMKDKIV
ncbi:hypothetical protein LTR53_005476, partial [Teratosphaeriaceae sp. CCFEE 6253]